VVIDDVEVGMGRMGIWEFDGGGWGNPVLGVFGLRFGVLARRGYG
jgi:hypothetical protein